MRTYLLTLLAMAFILGSCASSHPEAKKKQLTKEQQEKKDKDDKRDPASVEEISFEPEGFQSI